MFMNIYIFARSTYRFPGSPADNPEWLEHFRAPDDHCRRHCDRRVLLELVQHVQRYMALSPTCDTFYGRVICTECTWILGGQVPIYDRDNMHKMHALEIRKKKKENIENGTRDGRTGQLTLLNRLAWKIWPFILYNFLHLLAPLRYMLPANLIEQNQICSRLVAIRFCYCIVSHEIK